jgi:hypothetical protein
MNIPLHKLSRITLPVSAAAFISGLIAGAISYMDRSDKIEKFIPGSNAIPAHIVVFIFATIAVVLVIRTHSKRPKGTLILLSPFSNTAFSRFRNTLLCKQGLTLLNLLRAIVCIPLVFFFIFLLWRAGLQVIGGLDPNFVINAWGGPTYLGASMTHWLDAILMFYAVVAILNIIMIKQPDSSDNK